MREQTTFSVGIAIVLNEVSRMLLYKKVKNEQGQDVLVDREIPFRLKYRLNKNRMMLETDVRKFNQSRMIALAKYGEPSSDGNNVIITDPEKKEKFQNEIGILIDAQVTHPLNLLDPADFELINDTDMPISPEAMSIFTTYLVDDPDLKKDIELNVNFREYEEPKTEETVVEEPKTEEVAPVEEVKAETVVEEKPVKKASAKKTASNKTEEVKEEAPVKKTPTKSQTKRKNIMEGKPVLDGLIEEPKKEDAPKKTTTKKSTTSKKTEGETKTTAKKSTTTKKTTKKDKIDG